MKEYYCLLLNNSYDIESHWVSLEPFSVAPNIIVKETTDLSTIEDEFMGLDSSIVPFEQDYCVLGFFPIFGEIKEDGQMHDVVTGELIVKANSPKETSKISYKEKYKADSAMVEEMLTLLDKDSKHRYSLYIEGLAAYAQKAFHNAKTPEKYFIYRPNNSSINAPLSIAKSTGYHAIDCVTKDKLFIADPDETITAHLSTKALTEISKESAYRYQSELIDYGIEKYIMNIKNAKTRSIRNYNSYISLNKDYPKTKTKTK